MTRTTNTNTWPRLVQTCLATFIALLSASAVLAQDEPAHPSSAQAASAACTAQASLGELSLSGPSVPATPALTEANMDTANADAESRSSESESTSAPTPSGSEVGGFVSLAGSSPASATECAAHGSALASTQDLPASPANTSSTAVAELATEAPPALASAAAASVPVKQKKTFAPHRQSPSRETLQVWWPAPESGRLNLRFAGEAAFGQAIALLFDAPFTNPASADAHVQVLNRAGTVLKGRWQVVKSNPQMLALMAAPGTYTIRIGSDLVASNGLRFKQDAEGKILVR